MRATARSYGLVVMGALAIVLVGAATTWACTTSAHISLTPFEPSEPGTPQASVVGRDFVAGGPVKVYWEPAGGGPRELLFETEGASFARPLSLPAEAGEGVHVISAVGYTGDGDGEPAGQAAAVLAVDGEQGPAATGDSPTSGDLWRGAATGESVSLLTDGPANAGNPAGLGEQLAMAAALMGLGGLVLAGGTVAALRRRRVPAEAPAPTSTSTPA